MCRVFNCSYSNPVAVAGGGGGGGMQISGPIFPTFQDNGQDGFLQSLSGGSGRAPGTGSANGGSNSLFLFVGWFDLCSFLCLIMLWEQIFLAVVVMAAMVVVLLVTPSLL
jgi:hypothetical protein